jgi:hypothetical protein
MFVETIYKEMVKEHPPKAPAKGDQRNRTQKGSGK